MSPTAVVLAVLTAAAFSLLRWAIGRTVTAIGERASPHVSGHGVRWLPAPRTATAADICVAGTAARKSVMTYAPGTAPMTAATQAAGSSFA
jgi:ABC-type xylose transport system permease subunit